MPVPAKAGIDAAEMAAQNGVRQSSAELSCESPFRLCVVRALIKTHFPGDPDIFCVMF
jgi:hypothetical protein